MPEEPRFNWRVGLGLSLGLIVLDQLTKQWADAALADGRVIPVFSWFDFSLVYNTGAAFGFLNDAGGWQNGFFVVLALAVSVFLVWAMRHTAYSERQQGWGYALILGGAIGNLIDRIHLGYVIDFIHWYYQNWHWPHFNIADSAISVGAALLIADALGLRPRFWSRDVST